MGGEGGKVGGDALGVWSNVSADGCGIKVLKLKQNDTDTNTHKKVKEHNIMSQNIDVVLLR